ncbi:MAG: transglycosylase family protein [Candidatus Saccharibacteria bacterium]
MGLLATSAVTLFSASILATSSPTIANSTFVFQSKQSTTLASLDVKKVATHPPSAIPVPPAPQPKTIAVQPGDNLTQLAEANDTTSLRLFYANTDITDPDLIHPAQVLKVPAADETLTPRDVPINQQLAIPSPTESTRAAASQVASSATASVTVAGDSVWDSIAACESGGNWAINTGNGFYGGIQFTLSSWQAVGGTGYPNEASKSEQIVRAKILQSRQGWGAWPACTAKLGLS